jgi:hypothetical protein
MSRAGDSSSVLAPLVFLLAVGLAGWWAFGSDGFAPGIPLVGGPQLDEGWGEGSRVRCDVPLRWRLAEVDPRFGMSQGEVEVAIRQAGELWEQAAGAGLFSHHPDDGFPIRLVWDQRQEGADARQAADRELTRIADELEQRRRRLDDRRRALAREREELADRFRAFEERLARHNRSVAEWNQGARTTEGEGRRLEAQERELEQEGRGLEARTEALEGERRRLEEESERFNLEVSGFNQRVAEMEGSESALRIESGTYREEVETRNGRVVAVSRRIEIHHFAHREHLILLLAHELGHALGLPHVDEPEAVMAAAHGPRGEAWAGSLPRIHRADLEILREVCADLPGR